MYYGRSNGTAIKAQHFYGKSYKCHSNMTMLLFIFRLSLENIYIKLFHVEGKKRNSLYYELLPSISLYLNRLESRICFLHLKTLMYDTPAKHIYFGAPELRINKKNVNKSEKILERALRYARLKMNECHFEHVMYICFCFLLEAFNNQIIK